MDEKSPDTRQEERPREGPSTEVEARAGVEPTYTDLQSGGALGAQQPHEGERPRAGRAVGAFRALLGKKFPNRQLWLDGALIVFAMLAFWSAVVGLTGLLLRDLAIVSGYSPGLWSCIGVAALLWIGGLAYAGRWEIRQTIKEELALWRKRRGE